MIHHAAGSRVFWKVHELVTSLVLPDWISTPPAGPHPFFFLRPLSVVFPFQHRGRIEIIGPNSVWPGSHCSFWMEISSRVPWFPSDFRYFPFATAYHPLRWWRVYHHDSIISLQWNYNHGTLSYTHLQAWSSVCRLLFPSLLLSSSLFNMAHIQNGNLKGLLVLWQRPITFCSVLCYRVNEQGIERKAYGLQDDGEAVFVFLLEEPHRASSEVFCFFFTRSRSDWDVRNIITDSGTQGFRYSDLKWAPGG